MERVVLGVSRPRATPGLVSAASQLLKVLNVLSAILFSVFNIVLVTQ